MEPGSRENRFKALAALFFILSAVMTGLYVGARRDIETVKDTAASRLLSEIVAGGFPQDRGLNVDTQYTLVAYYSRMNTWRRGNLTFVSSEYFTRRSEGDPCAYVYCPEDGATMTVTKGSFSTPVTIALTVQEGHRYSVIPAKNSMTTLPVKYEKSLSSGEAATLRVDKGWYTVSPFGPLTVHGPTDMFSTGGMDFNTVTQRDLPSSLTEYNARIRITLEKDGKPILFAATRNELRITDPYD